MWYFYGVGSWGSPVDVELCGTMCFGMIIGLISTLLQAKGEVRERAPPLPAAL